MENLIGDYRFFFADILSRLEERNIDIQGYSMSHLGMRTTTFKDYTSLQEEIKKFCISFVENKHNGRLISKLLLKEPLILSGGFEVSLIELMPPKESYTYPHGLEHCGVVIGAGLEHFAEVYKDYISGRQDQGLYCQPYYITFENEKRIKFYDLSLKDVVEKEGYIFQPV